MAAKKRLSFAETRCARFQAAFVYRINSQWSVGGSPTFWQTKRNA
ncbi:MULTISPECIES: hypothetical protein [Kingella]|jgi:hypothetical protein|nr:hypothetical protein [Kingella bonacorsii]